MKPRTAWDERKVIRTLNAFGSISLVTGLGHAFIGGAILSFAISLGVAALEFDGPISAIFRTGTSTPQKDALVLATLLVLGGMLVFHGVLMFVAGVLACKVHRYKLLHSLNVLNAICIPLGTAVSVWGYALLQRKDVKDVFGEPTSPLAPGPEHFAQKHPSEPGPRLEP